MKRHAVAALVLVVGATVGTVQGAPPTAGAAAQITPNVVIGWNDTLARAALASGIAGASDFSVGHGLRSDQLGRPA